MNNFVGIDLGTTNSAIATYDGSETQIWKSRERNDVTPSAIYIDPRGNKHVGSRAYNIAPYNPNNCATLFKRLMGTSTRIELSAVDLYLTPEECSSEVLRVLFGYLPEEISNNADTGTVITVPAAFNQMQKDATMQAADTVGIGKVALMQEPVAAVMSVMRVRKNDGMFLIYDLGGGTLDIAIAESIGGRVNLLAHGGIQMCGGREFDRALVDNVVRPWLHENFDLPEDLPVNPTFKPLFRLATWAAESAKIELSTREDVVINLSEIDTRTQDLSGSEIYFDIPLRRDTYDRLIANRLSDTINCARETLSKAGLTPQDLECIVWIGGPTHYKPLRDKVSFEIGIPGNMEVDPMTAVAVGASLFAESIDWSSQNRLRKKDIGQVSAEAITFRYNARTSSEEAQIVVQVEGTDTPGSEFQIESNDTGWTSGRLPLKHNTTIGVPLTKSGDNTFRILLFNSAGGTISLEQNEIVITQTEATVDAIPASHTISVAVLDKSGGRRRELVTLVRSGDPLPKEGRQMFKAAESLEAGSSHSLNFYLWEGDIKEPIHANRQIGSLEIKGSDFADGVIPVGANIECDYKILDSGHIHLEVSVPCIGGTFRYRNYYSREEGQFDYASAEVRKLVEEAGEQTLDRIDRIEDVVDNEPRLNQARQKLESAVLIGSEKSDAEKVQEASEKVNEANKLIAQVREKHLPEIRQVELNRAASFFDEYIRQYAELSEETAFDNLVKTAQRSIDKNDSNFESYLDELRGKNFEILWRQDWFVIEQFKEMVRVPHLFHDERRFKDLAAIGVQLMRSVKMEEFNDLSDEEVKLRGALQSDDIEKLRSVVAQMSMLQINSNSDYSEMVVNILKG